MMDFIHKKGIVYIAVVAAAVMAGLLLAGFLFGSSSQGIFYGGFWYLLGCWAMLVMTVIDLVLLILLFYQILTSRRRSIWLIIGMIAVLMVAIQGIIYFQTAYNFQKALRGSWNFTAAGYASLANAAAVVSTGRMMALEQLGACACLLTTSK